MSLWDRLLKDTDLLHGAAAAAVAHKHALLEAMTLEQLVKRKRRGEPDNTDLIQAELELCELIERTQISFVQAMRGLPAAHRARLEAAGAEPMAVG